MDSAESHKSVHASLERIAGLLWLAEGRAIDQQRIIEMVAHWLSVHEQWLLVWDNIEDLDLLQRFCPLADRGLPTHDPSARYRYPGT